MRRLTRLLQHGLFAALFLTSAAAGQESAARDKWKQLSPEEQSRVLENYREWQKLPSDVRDKLQAKYKEFNALPPEARLRLRKLWQRIQALPAPKRERLLRLNREKWANLTPQERTEILNDLRRGPGREPAAGKARSSAGRDGQARGPKH